ncbi:MAG: SCO family protein [Halorientalis sp.]
MSLQRRDFVRGAGLASLTLAAGCLGGSKSSDGNPNVVLPEPDRDYTSSDLPFLAWGQQLPDVTVPAPLEDRTVAIRDVKKPRLFTFFYSHCQTVCPVLISTLRNVQTHALNNDYGDQVAFFPITFDPARDDAARLRAYADEMNVDADAGDWHFLRPKSEKRARTVITDDFGLNYAKQTSNMGHGTQSPHNGTQASTTSTQTTATGTQAIDTGTETGTASTGGTTSGNYMFTHSALILLANGDNYVERAYHGKSPKSEQIIADLKKVRNA